MPPYRCPELGHLNFASKFIRRELIIFVTDPGDILTSHAVLLEQEGKYGELRDALETNPESVDAGYYSAYGQGDPPNIIIYGDSSSLKLPRRDVARQAREETVIVFQAQSPDWNVVSG